MAARLSEVACACAVQAELQAKGALVDKLQELARSLQAQNRQMKEEDLQKRQMMLADFQSAVDDIKSRSAEPACCSGTLVHRTACKSSVLCQAAFTCVSSAATWKSRRDTLFAGFTAAWLRCAG